MTKRFCGLIILYLLCFNGNGYAQNSARIFQELKKLNVYGSVLYIAAHPDDENTRLLSYLANEKLYRTAYLSLTRGDGGQNLIGDEQGIDLGLIRTQELLDARRIDGATQFFTRAYDFGYSKSPDEAFAIWGYNEILADVVWAIRKFRPDVIITRFPTTGEGGHGHHTASAILASEAFDAAADEKKFPEQFALGVGPWKAKRLLWNTFNFGAVNTQNEGQFKIDVGIYNPVLGTGYGEMAAKSRSMHRSQGFGVSAQRGHLMEYFKTIKGTPPGHELMDGVITDISRFNVANKGMIGVVSELQHSLVEKFNIKNPSASLPELLKLKSLLPQALTKDNQFWITNKEQDIDKLIRAAAGLFMEVNAQKQFNVTGDSMQLSFAVVNRLGENISKVKMSFLGDVVQWASLPENEQLVSKKSVFIPADKQYSTPFYLWNGKPNGKFKIDAIPLRILPELNENEVQVSFEIQGLTVETKLPLNYKYTDPVKGEVYQPVFFVQPVEVSFEKDVVLIKPEDGSKIIQVRVKVNTPINDRLYLYAGEAGHLSLIADTIINADTGDELLFPVQIKYLKNINRLFYAEVALNKQPQRLKLATRRISYDHIPDQLYHYRDSLQVISPDIKISGSRIGYIAGAGDKVPEALEQMGYRVDLLSREQVIAGDLQRYDAIVTGVRAYNVHNWLAAAYKPLMNYVEQGGVLLVQYNTQNNIGSVKFNFAPYPFTISRSRITDEKAAVTMLNPEHRVWNYPNKISLSDFDGWIQERSIYSAEGIDPAYSRMISMKDPWPGEKLQDGSLIVADYGKGRFIYTGLVFFRELPAGIPGAYRIMANLLAK